MLITELIKRAKERANLTTDKQLCDALGVSHGAVHHWKTGGAIPAPEQALKLAKLAGIDPAPIVADVLQRTAKEPELAALFARIKRTVKAAAVCILCKIGDTKPGYLYQLLPARSWE